MENNISKQTKNLITDQADTSAKKITLELEVEQIKRELEMKEAELVELLFSLSLVMIGKSKYSIGESKWEDQWNQK